MKKNILIALSFLLLSIHTSAHSKHMIDNALIDDSLSTDDSLSRSIKNMPDRLERDRKQANENFEKFKPVILGNLERSYPLTIEQKNLLLQVIAIFRQNTISIMDTYKIQMLLQQTKIPESLLISKLGIQSQVSIPHLIEERLNNNDDCFQTPRNIRLFKQKKYEQSLSYTERVYAHIIDRIFPKISISNFIPINRMKGSDGRHLDSECETIPLYQKDNNNKCIMDQIIQAECEFDKQGYYTFVHGRPFIWSCFSDICKIIEELIHKKEIDTDQIIFRFRSQNATAHIFKKYRKNLVKNGADGVASALKKTGKNSEVIFMNRSLLSNLYPDARNSMSTLGYFLYPKHHDVYDVSNLLTTILKEHQLEDCIDPEAIENLLKKHKQCTTQTGELVMFAINKKRVNELVYPATNHGFRCGRKSAEYSLTHDPYESLNPHTDFYCLAVPDMPEEHYGDLYKTKSFAYPDPKKYKEYQVELQKFKESIAARLNSKI